MCGWHRCESEYAICREHWKRLNDDERWQLQFALQSPFYGFKGTGAFAAWGDAVDGSEKMRAYDAPDYRTWGTAEGVVRILTALINFEGVETCKAVCEQALQRFRERERTRMRNKEAEKIRERRRRRDARRSACADEDDDGEYV